MIGKLSGTIDAIAEDHAIIDVGGVGYLVHCASSTLARLTEGTRVSLAIETRVTDEAIRLYGFLGAEEREWFRLLQNVQSVGARVALSVLSSLDVRELERAIALGDKAAVGRAQGVGPKLATRIVTELKDKAPSMMLRAHAQDVRLQGSHPSGAAAEAVAALINLGYSDGEAAEAVARSARELPDAPADILIRESLRSMGRQKLVS
ncbi:MAG TPA: Holliday junction branch migration protein RuvA [Rhizomicrobium sp.]|jgi:Holliday junction DNA helicase RuvA